jgi:hypothetical protein
LHKVGTISWNLRNYSLIKDSAAWDYLVNQDKAIFNHAKSVSYYNTPFKEHNFPAQLGSCGAAAVYNTKSTNADSFDLITW